MLANCWFVTTLFLFSFAQFLSDAGLYESHEEAIGREEVLGRLDQVKIILLIWIFRFDDFYRMFAGALIWINWTDCEDLGEKSKPSKGFKWTACTGSQCQDFHLWILPSWGMRINLTICLSFLLKIIVVLSHRQLFVH